MMAQEWFSASELAAFGLPGMPATKANVLAMAERGLWNRPEWKDKKWRERQARGGGTEYHYSVLPQAAQIKLTVEQVAVQETSERDTAKRALTREEMWRWFESLPQSKKDEAKTRLEALQTIRTLTQGGLKKVFVMRQVAAQADVKLATLYNWEKMTHGVDRHDWLPYLAPRHAGRAETAECPEEAWEILKGDYLRPEQPRFDECLRRLKSIANKRGWTLPSDRTLRRRMDELPPEIVVLAREGMEALTRLYPAQQRDRSMFHALEAVNADFHTWDVFVKWSDGTIVRPSMICIQDLFSGKILGWRIDTSPNTWAVRLCLGDVIGYYGIFDEMWLDNGREFASKWMTGGVPNRYRFRVKADEPQGILTNLGVKIHWTTPYHGQSKPIERAFRDMCSQIAKHPRFAGAYVGNNPMAKPDNYGSAAVPLDVFLATLEVEIAAYNAQIGRRSDVCRGRSFDDVFTESYARSPIRKATAEQGRLWLLAAEAIQASSVDGSVRLLGNRYWSEGMTEYRGQKIVARFDPEKMHQPLHIYRLDGCYVGAAACIEKTGFADKDAARDHAKKLGKFKKAAKAALAAERSLTVQQVADALPAAEPAEKVSARLVRPVFGNTALKQKPIEQEEENPRQAAIFEALRQTGGTARLRVVSGDD